MTPSKEFVCDCSWYGEGFLQNSRIAHQLGPRRRSLRGLTLSLCSEFATINYGHVLYDVVPRIALFEQSGISYEQVDQILCNVGPAHRHLLAALNVPLEKVVWTDRSTTYQTERLITTTFPHIPRIIDPSSAQLIRARIPAIPDGSNRRLYIPREKRRRVANEQDLMLILDRRGFEVLNPAKSSTATRSAFAAAEIVVGSHGTGLADIVFGTPGAQLLELLPAHHAEPYFLAAAAAVGVGHRYVTVEGANHDDSVDPRKGQADVIVDLDVFERALDELISELP
jgi:capsular polysaccharide biosynthesis protein